MRSNEDSNPSISGSTVWCVCGVLVPYIGTCKHSMRHHSSLMQSVGGSVCTFRREGRKKSINDDDDDDDDG